LRKLSLQLEEPSLLQALPSPIISDRLHGLTLMTTIWTLQDHCTSRRFLGDPPACRAGAIKAKL
jgi:hypothetical protein